MLHNYTVTLQSKLNHKPRKFTTVAESISDCLAKLKQTAMANHYRIRVVTRKPLR